MATTLKTTLKTATIALILAMTVPGHTGGIPVFDGTAVSQAAQNSIKELAEMAKQLAEAKAQVEQLKANVNALTGVKGFSDVLEMGGLDSDVTNSVKDILNGNTSGLTEKASKYFDDKPSCEGYKDKSMCQQAVLSGVSQLDYAEKLNAQLDKKLKTITELSERAKQAKDMKSMAELQAQISLEGNSIAVLKQQSDNFAYAQQAKKDIVAKQAQERNNARRGEAIMRSLNRKSSSNNISDSKLNNIMN